MEIPFLYRGLYLPRQEARKRTHQTQRKGSRIPSKGQVALASKSSSHRSQTSDNSQGPSYFNPASLVKSKEGTFKPPRPMERYLGKHLKRCLSKEEWDALIKEHPLPDINACVPPKADKYLSDYLGRRFPRDQDAKLNKVQLAVLAIARPVVSAWQGLIESGINEDTDMSVPAEEVLTICQRTLCLIGNASELISQERRSKILESIDPAWTKYAQDSFPKAGKTLFGDDFKSALVDRVEKDTALSKAVAMAKRAKNTSQTGPSHFTRRDGQRSSQFFRRGPPAGYGSRRGKNPHHTSRDLGVTGGGVPYTRRMQPFPQFQRFGQRPQFHEPCFPTD